MACQNIATASILGLSRMFMMMFFQSLVDILVSSSRLWNSCMCKLIIMYELFRSIIEIELNLSDKGGTALMHRVLESSFCSLQYEEWML